MDATRGSTRAQRFGRDPSNDLVTRQVDLNELGGVSLGPGSHPDAVVAHSDRKEISTDGYPSDVEVVRIDAEHDPVVAKAGAWISWTGCHPPAAEADGDGLG